MSNRGFSSNALLDDLRSRLPDSWTLQAEPAKSESFDLLLRIAAPNGEERLMAVDLKNTFEPRDIDRLRRQFSQLQSDTHPMLFAPYLSDRSRELLRESDISFADATGTAHINAGGIYIDVSGQKRAPNSEHAPIRSSLRGPITGRIVRYLCDFEPPYRVRQIAMDTNVHAGNVSRILDFLERERLVVRDANNGVQEVFWEPLIRRWSSDLRKGREWLSFLEPHGLENLMRGLRSSDIAYAITGPLAAYLIAPAAAPIAVHIYVPDIERARKALSLRPAEHIGNVMLTEPFDRVALERTMNHNSLVLAAASQIAADVLTVPARSTDQFDALIGWMKHNEEKWRHE